LAIDLATPVSWPGVLSALGIDVAKDWQGYGITNSDGFEAVNTDGTTYAHFDSDVDHTDVAAASYYTFRSDVFAEATSGVVGGHNYYGLDFNWDFQNNGAAFFILVDVIPFRISLSVDSGTTVSNLKFFDCSVNALDSALMDFVATGTGNASGGMFFVEANDNSGAAVNAVVACRTAAIVNDTTNSVSAVGYQGYAQNTDTSTSGQAVAMQPLINQSAGCARIVAMTPLAISSQPVKSRRITLSNTAFGHIVCDGGGLAVMSTSATTLAANPATHVTNWNAGNAEGFLYVEEDAEVDGRLWCDGQLRLPIKTTTGDPGSAQEGDVYVNTFDRVMKVYANAAWRQIANW
jgi:hypothetical protein